MKNQKKFTSRSNKLKKQGTNSQTISAYHVRYSLTGISTDILFSSLVSFAFCLVAVFFVCLFAFKLKIYILLHIRQCRRVNDKKIFTQPISGHKIAFFLVQICMDHRTNVDKHTSARLSFSTKFQR